MATFLHIGLAFHGPPKVAELEPVFAKALDWVRYAPNCWIVYTNSTPERWLGRLKPHLAAKDHVLIVEVQIGNRSGWLPKWIWEWIKSHATA